MNVMTVTGPVPIENLGVILPHEHLVMAFDWPGLFPDVSHRPDLVWKKVTMENLGELRRNYCAIHDNAMLNNIDEICEEVALYKKAGGGTIMEMSTYGLYGNPAALKEISQRTGVYIIAGTGYYLDQTFSNQIREMTIEQMMDVMLRDIEIGFFGTDVKAGIIGEVATSAPMTPAEERSIRAAARVQRVTGLSMNVHVGIHIELCRQVIRILKEEGADLKKVIFAHCDGPAPLEHYREIAAEGIFMELDCFGNEFYVDNGSYDGDFSWYFASDGERIRTVKKLIDEGLENSIVLSQDVCSKMQTVKYGGYGYAHLLENIVPMLECLGVPREIPVKMMTQNTIRFLKGT